MDAQSIVLEKFDVITDFLIKNQFFDEGSLSELFSDIDENDRENKLKRIIENIETRDREDIDKFAILMRKSELFNEDFLKPEDECDSALEKVKHKLIVRLKDLLSTPKACGEVLAVKEASKMKSTKYGDVYKMTSKPRGFCVVIDNQSFTDSKLPFRAGSRADADRLSDVFSQLGFSIFRYVNKTAEQVESILKQFSRNDDLIYHDALAVIILSHGVTDAIYGSDGETIKVDDILSLYNNRNCRLLINKPKMFFLSACRGHEIDTGTEYYELDMQSAEQTAYLSHSRSLSQRSLSSIKSQVPTWSDMFVYFSSVSGYASLRNVNTGSWFGYELAHTIAEYAHREHLNDLVTIRVGERLQERESESHGSVMKQAIESLTRGRVKKLYFNPGF